MLDDWLQAAEFVRSLSDAGYQPPYADRANEAGNDYTGAFLSGQYAMVYNGDWLIEMLNTSMANGDGKVNYDIAPLPHWEGVDAQTTGAPGLLMVAEASKHVEEAYDFICFCSGAEGAAVLLDNDYLPAWQSEETIAQYTQGVETPEHVEFIVNQIINSQVPCDPNYNAATNIVKDEVSLYLLCEQDLETTKANILDRFEFELELE